jgi:uncharacterized phiE125 gp8 family phage protein
MQIIMRESWRVCQNAQFLRLLGGHIYALPHRLGVSLLRDRRAYVFPPHLRSNVMMTGYKARRVVRSADPASEPISLSEAKTFLRIDGTDEDALITEMISAARIAAEEQTGKSLISQSWQVMYDDCPPPVVPLAHGPVQSVTSVKSIAENVSETVIAATSYHLNALQELVFESVPSGHQIVIEYVAGFGAASDVPANLVQGVLLHVANLYEHRDSMTPPLASMLHYSAHREVRL